MNNAGKCWKRWKMSGSCGRQVGAIEDKWEPWKTSGSRGSPQKRSEKHKKGRKDQDVTVRYRTQLTPSLGH